MIEYLRIHLRDGLKALSRVIVWPIHWMDRQKPWVQFTALFVGCELFFFLLGATGRAGSIQRGLQMMWLLPVSVIVLGAALVAIMFVMIKFLSWLMKEDKEIREAEDG